MIYIPGSPPTQCHPRPHPWPGPSRWPPQRNARAALRPEWTPGGAVPRAARERPNRGRRVPAWVPPRAARSPLRGGRTRSAEGSALAPASRRQVTAQSPEPARARHLALWEAEAGASRAAQRHREPVSQNYSDAKGWAAARAKAQGQSTGRTGRWGWVKTEPLALSSCLSCPVPG